MAKMKSASPSFDMDDIPAGKKSKSSPKESILAGAKKKKKFDFSMLRKK